MPTVYTETFNRTSGTRVIFVDLPPGVFYAETFDRMAGAVVGMVEGYTETFNRTSGAAVSLNVWDAITFSRTSGASRSLSETRHDRIYKETFSRVSGAKPGNEGTSVGIRDCEPLQTYDPGATMIIPVLFPRRNTVIGDKGTIT